MTIPPTSIVPALQAFSNTYAAFYTNVVLDSLNTLLPLVQQLKAASNANEVEAAVTGLTNALSNGHPVVDLADKLSQYAPVDWAARLDSFADAVRQHGTAVRQYLTVLGSNVSELNTAAIEAAVKELQQAGQGVFDANNHFAGGFGTMGIVIQQDAITGGTLELDVALIGATGSVIQTLTQTSNAVVNEALNTLIPELNESIVSLGNDYKTSFPGN